MNDLSKSSSFIESMKVSEKGLNLIQRRKNPRKDIPIPSSMYFGGCAWGNAFYVGVYMAMVDTWGSDFHNHTVIYGGSAGTLFALGISTGKTPESLYLLYKSTFKKAKYHRSVLYGPYYLEDSVRKIVLDNPLTYQLIEGKCYLSTTAYFAKHQWHGKWSSNEDLINCAKASGHIPIYSPYNYGVDSMPVVDGAYSFSGKDFPDGNQTLYIGIHPLAEISGNLTALQLMKAPYSTKQFNKIVQYGYDTFMNWDGVMNQNKVELRKPDYATLRLLWILKGMEMIPLQCISNYENLSSYLSSKSASFSFKSSSSSSKNKDDDDKMMTKSYSMKSNGTAALSTDSFYGGKEVLEDENQEEDGEDEEGRGEEDIKQSSSLDFNSFYKVIVPEDKEPITLIL